MLCTRMRLTERRFRIKSSITYHNGDGDFDAQTAISSDVRTSTTTNTGPFVRPCAIIKMCNANQNQMNIANRPTSTSTSSSSASSPSAMNTKLTTRRKFGNENEMEIKTDVSESQSNINRSVDDSEQKRITNANDQSTSSSYRAPLIIVSLYLPSEAKTLAPIDIKRDLRRPPSFCQKYQRNFGGSGLRTQCKCKCKINDKPDLMLRGHEITETSSTACTSPPPSSDTSNQDSGDGIRGILNGDKLNDNGDECMACSACILEIERNRTPTPLSITARLNETELRFSYNNKYHMDAYGNLNQNLEISCDDGGGGGDDDDSPEVSLTQHSRPGTPDASRIIRITLNNKSNTTDDDHRRNISCSGSSDTINGRYDNVDDKQNLTSCRSIKSATM